MKNYKLIFCIGILVLIITSSLFAQQIGNKGNNTSSHPITVEDLWKFKRLDKFVISKDGSQFIVPVKEFDMDKNSGNNDLWLISLKGGNPRRLTNWEKNDSNPVFLPDGNGIIFISDRTDDTPQVYMMPLNGGEPIKITDMPNGVGSVTVSSDGNGILFNSDVFPDCPNIDCTKERMKQRDESKVKAKIFDDLLFRVWDSWRDNLRSHVFYMSLNGGTPVDITSGNVDCPPIDLGSDHDFIFSPDSKKAAVVINQEKGVAWSTNNDIFLVSIKGGILKKITNNNANDEGPIFSPNGKFIAYRAMKKAGFEADRRRLAIYDIEHNQTKIITENFDYSVRDLIWTLDSRDIYFTSIDQGNISLFKVNIANGEIEKIIDKGATRFYPVISPQGEKIYYLRNTNHEPSEIYYFDLKTKNEFRITHFNDDLTGKIIWGEEGDFWFNGAKNEKIHTLYVKPPQFDSNKKYPVLFLMHGGPQESWMNNFHYRWNSQLFASKGYFVVMINFHGSTGYGQDFVDSVSKNWGTYPYEDIMKGVDYIIQNFSFADPDKLAGIGASYGGFMINWILGHTDRFKCLVSHAGIADQFSMYGTTEELWFPEWEFNGIPWEHPELYEKFSPIRYAKNFHTPTLIIHGANDFRVPFTEGFQMFTALKRQGIPSRLIFFPDETHFISKPQNARLWWNEIFNWLGQYIQ